MRGERSGVTRILKMKQKVENSGEIYLLTDQFQNVGSMVLKKELKNEGKLRKRVHLMSHRLLGH